MGRKFEPVGRQTKEIARGRRRQGGDSVLPCPNPADPVQGCLSCTGSNPSSHRPPIGGGGASPAPRETRVAAACVQLSGHRIIFCPEPPFKPPQSPVPARACRRTGARGRLGSRELHLIGAVSAASGSRRSSRPSAAALPRRPRQIPADPNIKATESAREQIAKIRDRFHHPQEEYDMADDASLGAGWSIKRLKDLQDAIQGKSPAS